MSRASVLAALVTAALLLAAPRGPVHAQDACGDLTDQIAAQDQALERLEFQAVPWLQQAGSSVPRLLVSSRLPRHRATRRS